MIYNFGLCMQSTYGTEFSGTGIIVPNLATFVKIYCKCKFLELFRLFKKLTFL